MTDRTIRDLIASYKADEDSSFGKPEALGGLRYQVRKNYTSLLNRIEADHGDVVIASLNGRAMLGWHKAWAPRGAHMAHGLIRMVRGLFSYGMTLLECPQCTRMSIVMSKQRFPMGRSTNEQRLTVEQINAIRSTARSMNLAAIALAQAIEFEGTMRQRDVIGEYVPLTAFGKTDIVSERYGKWLRGLRWEEINGALVLRHMTSKKGKPNEIDLNNAPMVLVELQSAYCDLGEDLTRDKLPKSGPIIIDPDTGLPYAAHKFRWLWRKIANIVGVPKNVKNMHSRHSAISEADEAGADLDDIRESATHSDVKMTRHYSRAQATKTARVMKLRVASRAPKA